VTTIVRKSYPGTRCYLLGELIQDTGSRYYYRPQLGAKLAFVVGKSPSHPEQMAMMRFIRALSSSSFPDRFVATCLAGLVSGTITSV
jgi:hypothetical protein